MPRTRSTLRPADVPSYGAAEAARILGLPVSTVRNWSFGQTGKLRPEQRTRFPSVIDAADPKARLLSFANLCELHVLSGMRRAHRVSLPNVRKGLRFVRDRLGAERPLLDTAFLTNGLSLFVEHAELLLDVSKGGQTALREDFERALARIERDGRGQPIRLFPFTRLADRDATQPAIVAIDPTVAFGRPVLMRAGVRTEVIADRFAAGDDPREMAADYGVPEVEILEALRYEGRIAKAA